MERLQINHKKFPHDAPYPIDVESGIQLGMTDCQFPRSFWTFMIELQAAFDDSMNYLLRNILLKLERST
jgi:hypothetical protein